jgi:hypothetical protein
MSATISHNFFVLGESRLFRLHQRPRSHRSFIVLRILPLK